MLVSYYQEGFLMEHLMRITLYGFVSGLAGTGLGGLSAFLVSRADNRAMSTILEFSAGLMTAVVCFELLPEAFKLGGTFYTFAGIISGIIAVVVIENFLKKSHMLSGGNNKGLLKAGILMAIAISLHNFPEGFAVGSGFEASASLGLTITAAIIIHDIPEGIAMAVPMRAGGFSKLRAFVYTLLSGVPMGFGALLGAALGQISGLLTASCLGFAGGAMLYIIYGELVPESKRLYLGRLSSLANVCGILCGIIISICN
jgi:ZIP family zinc transporter